MHMEVPGRQKGGGLGAETAPEKVLVTQALGPYSGSLRSLHLTVVFVYNFKVIEGRFHRSFLPDPSQQRWTE